MKPARASETPPFAVVLPVGPDAVGLWRGVELLKSLVFWEPFVKCCIVLDDALASRGLSDLAELPSGCHSTTILTPPPAVGASWIGRLTGGLLNAFAWIHENTDAKFILRIDADALVVGPFSSAIDALIGLHPNAGIIGTLGLSSNSEARKRINIHVEPKLLRTARLLDTSAAGVVDVPGVGAFDASRRSAFHMIRPHIVTARDNGYRWNEVCQGGVNVVTRLMLARMGSLGSFESALAWAALPFADDRVMAMYARATAVELLDASEEGELFGVQARGLPYPPIELVQRGHSLIHSVRNDRTFTEIEIREFFRARMRH